MNPSLSPIPAAPATGVHAALSPPLRVRTLGVFAVWWGDEPIPATAFAQRKSALLFQALLAAPGYRLSRERLLDVLWPDAGPEQAGQRLRSTLHRLRGALGAVYLPSVGDLVLLDPAPGAAPSPDWLDAEAFEHAAAAALASDDLAAARAALGRYSGEYLPAEPDEGGTGERRRALRALARALTLHTARLAPPPEAERLLASVLREEPAHEEAALALMRLLEGQGRPAEALRIYDVLAAALADELGLDPGPSLQQLRQRLLAPPTPTEPPTPLAPPAPSGSIPTNTPPTSRHLPTSLAPLVGRAAELATLHELLRSTRLLTLIGTGGVGKTRLALELAHRMRPDYPDGVRWVDLSSLADPALAPQAVAAALDVREEPGRDLTATLAASLRARPDVLLLLDNAEQVLDAIAALIAALLAACPRLQVAATSRAALGLTGETLYHVPSLTLPTDDSPAAVAASASAQFVAARARAVAPGVAFDDASAPLVAALCRRLDGIPLALELAAARLAVLSLPQLVARLDDRFRLLTMGSRTAPPRHRTLRATLDWSHDLLAEPERALLRRLAVFAGGWTLDAAEAVRPADADTGVDADMGAGADALDLLAALVSQSLVVVDMSGEEARYRLLETVRAYARARLAEAGEAEDAARRHADWALGLAEEAELGLAGPEQARWLARLEREHDNLRAALAWARDAGGEAEAERGLRIARALWRFWVTRGHLREGREWLETLHRRVPLTPATVAIHAAVCKGAGVLAWKQGAYEEATRLSEEALALSRRDGDTASIASVVNNLGSIAYEQARYDRAGALFAEALRLAREIAHPVGIAHALNNLGNVVRDQGNPGRATMLYEESLARRRALGDEEGAATVLQNLAGVAREQGAYGRARALYRECLALHRSLGATLNIATCLEEMACLHGMDGQAERSALLFGAATALRENSGAMLPPVEQRAHDAAATAAKAQLGDGGFAEAWSAGRQLSLARAVDVALGDGSPRPTVDSPATNP